MDSNGEKMGLKRIMKNIFRLMNEYKFQFIFIGILAIISILFNIISPLLLGDAINILIEGANNIINHTGTFDFDRLCYILLIVGALYIISNVVSYIQSYFMIKITSNIIYSLKKRMMHKAIHMPMKSIDENQRGDVIARLTNDLDNLQIALSSSFLEIITTILTLIGTFCMMLLINSWLTFAIICIILLSSALIGVIIRFSQKYFEKQMLIQGSTAGQIEEIISSQELVRTLNYENQAIDEFNDNVNEWYNFEWKSRFFSSLNTPMTTLNFNLGYVAIAVLGSISVLQGTMSIGRVLSFFEYLKNFTNPLENLTEMLPHLQAGIASAERIFEFIEMEEEEENPSTKKLETFENEITFDNISFGYTEDEIDRMVNETAQLLHIETQLNKYPGALSGGQLQRAGIARAIVHRPEILLLDEPFSSLDKPLRAELIQELDRIRRDRGMTMIYVTHDVDEIRDYADSIVELRPAVEHLVSDQ